MTDTSTGGYLVSPVLPDGTDDLFKGFLSGLTDLPLKLVQPAYHDINTVFPSNTVDWLSFWVTRSESDDAPVIGVGSYVRNYQYSVTVYCYGPLSREYMDAIVDGVKLRKNMDTLYDQGWVYQDIDVQPTMINELFNNLWYRRHTATLLFGRHISKDYGVLELKDGPIIITQ